MSAFSSLPEIRYFFPNNLPSHVNGESRQPRRVLYRAPRTPTLALAPLRLTFTRAPFPPRLSPTFASLMPFFPMRICGLLILIGTA
jgi:hypothetical protein